MQLLDSFRLFKVKDLLSFSVEEVSNFLGKMIDLSVTEQKKLMVALRASRQGTEGPSEAKFDLFGLELRTSKKKKGTVPRPGVVISKPQSPAKVIPAIEDTIE